MKRRYAEGGATEEDFSDYLDAHRKALRDVMKKKDMPDVSSRRGVDSDSEEEAPVRSKLRKYVPGIGNALDAYDFITKGKKPPVSFKDAPVVQHTYKKGGKVGSASKRADGCCKRGKTRGKFV